MWPKGRRPSRARPRDSDGNEVQDAFDVEVVKAPEPKPGPVVDMELTATADSITVAWSAPEKGGEPKRYIVRRKKVDSDEKSKMREPKAPKTSLTFRHLEAGATYEVSVRAENKAGKGERTVIQITLPEAEVPEEGDSQSEQ